MIKQHALIFAAGVLTFQFFEQLPGWGWLILGFVVFALSASLKLWRLTFFVAGLGWSAVFAWFYHDSLLPIAMEGQDLTITGRVIGLPSAGKNRVSFNFAPDRSANLTGVPKTLRLNWYHPEHQLKPGQQWRLTVRLKQAHGLLNPGGFDYERWLFRQNIGATGYVRKHPEPFLLANSDRWNIDRFRAYLSEKITKSLPNSENTGFIQALVIGEKQRIKPEQWQVLAKTGTIHLLAISGLHIGMVAALTYFLVLRLWSRFGFNAVSAVAAASMFAGIFSFLYAALAGFSVSTLRALIMLMIVMLAVISKRNLNVTQLLSLSLLVFLLINPLTVLSPGFWLSFIAVVIIFYCLCGRLQTVTEWRAMIIINCALAVGLMPLIIYFFQQLSLLSPFANLLAIPLISFIIVPLALLGSCMIFFNEGLSVLLLQGADLALTLLFQLLSYLAAWPYAQIPIQQPDWFELVLALMGVFVLLMPKSLPGRGLGLLLIAPLFLHKQDEIEPGAFRLSLLDIGQGLSIVVQTRSHIMLYDAGMKLDEKMDMGRNVVLPYLYHEGRYKLDLLLVSHGDNDHSGGAFSILDTIPVKQVKTSVPELFPKQKTERCVDGQTWLWNQVKFEILSPPRALFYKENDNSCVLKITSQYGSVLIPGDIERSAEQWLLDHHRYELASAVLIAPHHGSKTSSSLVFLEQVKPEYILISSGYNNRFRHPHESIIARYEELGLNWFNTAQQGAITVAISEQGIQLNRYRESNRLYWNREAHQKY